MKLNGESYAATIFFTFARLATGIWETQKKIVNKCGFIVFKMTAQNTQSEQQKTPALNIAIGPRNLQKTLQNPPTNCMYDLLSTILLKKI